MQKLDDFNSQRRLLYLRSHGSGPVPNGIACPNCDAEMLDSCPQVTLTSNPPQKNVHCPRCGYKGYRIE